ncbi:hypothetical protein AR457_09965 [Streptomyces agglomeratus]|uniref:hypothetical protein n=1 Tax=Streptomyces agglomeratus TaxID=285458 RepID=UPI0008544A62|nr:hypothetical protein [Streptomyces agglomeratus]OEJ41242.1 hypothetical protein BGK70_26695 [Streptomyces agglomeratus]OEJ44380.1 hypothetical protein AR457_09965 [Streptomyces agglomeratus]
MSAQSPVCHHRVFEVLLVTETAAICGMLIGIVLAVIGVTPVPAMAAGGTVSAFVFGAGMNIVGYLKKQDR